MKFILSLTISLFLISACTQHTEKQFDKNAAFHLFLSKFKPIQLPYRFPNDDNYSYPEKEFQSRDNNSLDTLYIKPDYKDEKVF